MSMELMRSAEWDILCALPTYLAIPLVVNDNVFDDLEGATISSCNLRDNFAFEFTRILLYFVRNRVSRDAPGEAFEKTQQLKLERFCQLLDSIVNPLVIQSRSLGEGLKFDHLFIKKNKNNKSETVVYPRLRTLLEYLGETKALLALIYGHSTPAFVLPSAKTIEEDLKTVQDLNHFFDSWSYLSSQDNYDIPESATSPLLGDLTHTTLRNYAVTAFDTMFDYLKVCQTTHKIMLHLSGLADNANARHEAHLDLFISTCPDHEDWQEARCGASKYLPPTPFVSKLQTNTTNQGMPKFVKSMK
jgi:hypothetical protein